jgi:ubiquinone/menaquinone biosynthesis C-methylase UbiE
MSTGTAYLFANSPIANRMLGARTFQSEGAFAQPCFKPGMHVLDAGCGPGTITCGIAALVAPGCVTAVDNDAHAIEKAALNAQQAGISNITLLRSDLTTHPLPFAAESFDAVWMHAVLYHLEHAVDCARELLRLLKPNGFLAVRDSFYPGDIVYPPTPTIRRAFQLTELLLRSRGADPSFGPKHREVLLQAGFKQANISASYENFSAGPMDLTGYAQTHVDFLRQLKTRGELIANGLTTEDELQTIERALLDWGNSSSGVFLRCRCEAIAWKSN